MFRLSHLALSTALLSSLPAIALTIVEDPQKPGSYLIAKADIEAAAAAKTSNPMYQVWSKALETADNGIVNAVTPNNPSNPSNVKRVERVFGAAEWQFLTQMAAPEYTYTRFLQAVAKFPAFCGEYSDGRNADAICKKSIVTAFAHFSQETGGHIAKDNLSDNPNGLEEWQQALVHVREMGWQEGQAGYTTGCGQNDWQNRRWPCKAGEGYFGRGAKQLSYHYNYGAFSEAMFDGDATVLLNNPALVADSWLNLASAIWFFLTPQAPKPAMLHVVDRTWQPSSRETAAGIGYGFGTTINVINGGIECGEQNKTKGQPVNRIRYWQGLREHYNIPFETDEEDTCWQQTPYGSLNLNGATDVLYTNWEGDWAYYADRPGGYAFECKLVGYQTAYSALVKGDYEKCVTNFYQSHANWPQVTIVDSLPTPTEPPTGGEGSWDANKVYLKGDKVTYKNATYEAQWWTQGNAPDLGGPWKLISGTVEPTPEPEPTPDPEPTPEPTPTPDPITGPAAWSNTQVYVGGDLVSHNNQVYKAKWWTKGDNPTDGGPWQVQ